MILHTIHIYVAVAEDVANSQCLLTSLPVSVQTLASSDSNGFKFQYRDGIFSL